MKRFITGVIAVTLILTSVFIPETSALADSMWDNAVAVTEGNTASYNIDFKKEAGALFKFTAPSTRYYTFTVVKQFENYSSGSKTAIFVTDKYESFIAYNVSETPGSSLKISASAAVIKNQTYYISVYDEGYTGDLSGCEIQLKAERHYHTSYVSGLKKARYGKDGYYEYTCTSCENTYKKKIPGIASVKLSKSKYTYNGKSKKPVVTVKDEKGKLLEEKTDYTLSYTANKAAGTAKAVVKFKGKYKGTQKKYFFIIPKKQSIKKLNVKKNSALIKWGKLPAGVKGIEIQYSRTKSFKKKKRVFVSKSRTSRKLNKLNYSTKYYFRVRPYSYDSVNKKRLYSNWSKVKTVKTGRKAVKKKPAKKKSQSGGGGGSSYSGHVYVTPTGECYHFSKSCAGKNAIETDMDDAKSYYRPCKKCT